MIMQVRLALLLKDSSVLTAYYFWLISYFMKSYTRYNYRFIS